MNLSHQPGPNEFHLNCVVNSLTGDKPVDFSIFANAVLIAFIVIHATTCPVTILLNLLVMIAVKTKARLQRKSNIALACLASTDLLVGFAAQPLLIAVMVNLLKGDTTTGFFQLSPITYPFIYIQTITKSRVLIGSALAWTLTVIIHIVFFIDDGLFESIISVLGTALIVIILLCNAIVYREARRREKQIASQQVDAATRENFLSQKRAFKLTLTIIALVIISYLPTVSFRKLREPLKDIVNLDKLWAIHVAVSTLVILNSLVNPLVYYLRVREFRVALIELLMRKNHNEAEEFEEKIFWIKLRGQPWIYNIT
ncbi:uncharacterized protein [Porites lutea]|uniref:uncharacterized protein n=1 Tax=Porites lutea TaxID=51062 RepID=UPI003CC5FF7D